MISRKTYFNYINQLVVDLPAPRNLSFAWSFGSLLGLCFVIQLIRGLFLAIHYCSSTDGAFISVIIIQRGVPGGWFIQSLHANGARIFFIFIYLHIARGIFYGSYLRNKITWISGVVIYLISMIVAFIGYLLPWGQIRYWGATVITNLFSAVPIVGADLVMWLWGGFRVGGPTLRRFFVGHFTLPFLLIFLILLHLSALHIKGSSNPLGVNSHRIKMSFHSYFSWKDSVGFALGLCGIFIIVFFIPYFLGDPENFMGANELVTPTHIKPEWYFLWLYAILRSIPNKLGGVIALFAAILVLFTLPYKRRKISFWPLIVIVILLSWIGASPVEYPYIDVGGLLTAIYYIIILTCHYITNPK